MLPIPTEIVEFVAEAAKDYQDTGVDIGSVYAAKIANPELLSGSGVCLKMEEGPYNKKRPTIDESVIRFTLSDGTYSVDCLAHNGPEDGHLPWFHWGHDKESPDEWLSRILMLLTESIRDGRQLMVTGLWWMDGRDKVFVVNDVEPYETRSESQMTDEQFEAFMELCNKHGPQHGPLHLMLRDDTLWSKLHADDPIKKAVMLFCLSPQSKQDMMHVGIVSSVGEGKDHLIETVIEPLVPCGVASTGKLCTIPGLFGAMNGEDLNSIELGLIPKMDNERIAVSEFQTWGQEVFGELMNVMANGSFTMQKGQVDTKRYARTNFMFLGNPPRDWNEDKGQMGMMAAFGEYTFQIMSRLTLIFARMQLTDGDNTSEIEDKIMDSMNGVYKKKEFNETLEMWRKFFREYLRYVSVMQPNYDSNTRKEIQEAMDRIKVLKSFDVAFLGSGRAKRDFRKFQEFVNLCRGFARLNGESEVSTRSIFYAEKLFKQSLRTLEGNFEWLEIMNEGGTTEHAKILNTLRNKVGPDGVYTSFKEMQDVSGMNAKQLQQLVDMRYIVITNEEERGDPLKATWFEIKPQ